MALTEYPYNKPAIDPDKPEETVDCAELDAACTAAGVPGIQGSAYDGTTVTVYTDPALSAGDETLLADTVAAYTQNNSPLKLDRYVENPPVADPRGISFTTGLTTKLYKWIDTADPDGWYRGEVRRVEYHGNTEHTDLVVKAETQYVRNADGSIYTIDPRAQWGDPDFRGARTVWTWMREDGTAWPALKIADRVYDSFQSMREGRNRRQAVVDNVAGVTLGLLLGTGGTEADGVAYMEKYENQLTNYVRTGDLSFTTPPAVPNITDDTEPWLDNDVSGLGYPAGTTIRDVILSLLQPIV